MINENIVRRAGWWVLVADALVVSVLATRLAPAFSEMLDDPEYVVFSNITTAQFFGFLAAVVLFLILVAALVILLHDDYGLFQGTNPPSRFSFLNVLSYTIVAVIILGEPVLSATPFLDGLFGNAGLGSSGGRWWDVITSIFLAVIITLAHLMAGYLTAAQICLYTRDKWREQLQEEMDEEDRKDGGNMG